MSESKSRPKSIDDYIRIAPPEAQERLREMYQCLREVAPDAEEGLKWGSPALWYGTILFIFAAHTRHISLYPTPPVIRAFAGELEDYKTSSSTVQFPLERPLPLPLIRRMAAYRVKCVVEDNARWM